MDTELKSLRIDRSQKRPTPNKPVGRIIGVTIGGLALLAIAIFLYKRITAAVPVRVTQVPTPSAGSTSEGETILTATGYIVAAHKIEVASKVVGRVLSIGVEKGDKVKAGQVLVRLESDEYQAQLRQQKGQLANLEAKLAELRNGSRPEEIAKARADHDEAGADLENAKVSLERTRQLSTDGVVSKQALDDANAKYSSAESKVLSLQRTLDLQMLGPRREEIAQVEGQIEQARGALQYAQTELDNTVIKAPVDGTILDRNVEKGEFVTNGFVGEKGAKGYLVTMADLNDLQVELDINQAEFPKLSATQKGIVTTDAYPDRKYQGVLKEVSPEADRAKATVQVKVQVSNPDSYLRPDMNATVSFYNDPKPGADAAAQPKVAILIPAAAVQNGAVFVVLDGRARRRAITVGPASERGVTVSSGLVGGEDLITNPPADMKDGQRVQVAQ